MSLSSFLQGVPSTRWLRVDGRDVELANLLWVMLPKVVRAGTTLDDERQRALALGVIGATSGALPSVTGESWCGSLCAWCWLAQNRFALVDVTEKEPERKLRDWQADALFVTALRGRLMAGNRLLRQFTEQRVIFGQPLAAQPLVIARDLERRSWVHSLLGLALGRVSAAAESDRVWKSVLGIACEDAASRAQELLQAMGGTGFMRDSGMPAIYEDVLGLIQQHRACAPVSHSEARAAVEELADLTYSDEASLAPGPRSALCRDLLEGRTEPRALLRRVVAAYSEECWLALRGLPEGFLGSN